MTVSKTVRESTLYSILPWATSFFAVDWIRDRTSIGSTNTLQANYLILLPLRSRKFVTDSASRYYESAMIKLRNIAQEGIAAEG